MKKFFSTFCLLFMCLNSQAQSFNASAPCTINSQDPDFLHQREYRRIPREATFKWRYPAKDGKVYTCTGTLINRNTSVNGLGYYFITAQHCSSDADLSKVQELYFNYQSPNSDTWATDSLNRGISTEQSGYKDINSGYFTPNGYEYKHTTRIRLVANYEFGDFALMEILTPIPPHFNVSFAGWNPTSIYNGFNSTPSIPSFNGFHDYIGIHHPKGDIKKISTVNNIVWLESPVATGCRFVTMIIDVLFGWIWGQSYSTQEICDYVDNPFIHLTWGRGISQKGSSGSGLFNKNNDQIGIASYGPENFCNLGNIQGYSKLRYFYSRQPVRNTLNPSHDFWVEYNGMPGYKRVCYDNLELPGVATTYPTPAVSGHYFPAKHYQPQNTIFLQANNNIDIVRPLHVYNEADYRFRAGNVITINPGFEAETGSTVVFENGLCGGSAKEINPQQQLLAELSKIKIPKSKTFDAQSLAAGTLYGNPQSLVMDVFPNPSTSTFTIRLPQKGDYEITVTNLLGSRVALFFLKDASEGAFTLPVPPGTYLLKVSGNGQTAVGKINIVE